MLRINVRIGTKRIAWIYYQYSGRFDGSFILPWALRDYTLLPESSPVDFMVLVTWPHHKPAVGEDPQLVKIRPFPKDFLEFKGPKFALCGEPGGRYLPADNCFQFVNAPRLDDPPDVRYCPAMGYWAPPLEAPAKRHACSAIDSGKWNWRLELIRNLVPFIKDIHVFGHGVGKPLGGYHEDDRQSLFGTSKHLGLVDYAFSIAAESYPLADYWTEKLGDATLCEAVAIYQGAPNIFDYYIPESLLLVEDTPKIDWENWSQEYARRRPYVLQQKELLRTRFNVFSYFHRLTSDLSLLDKPRPITR